MNIRKTLATALAGISLAAIPVSQANAHVVAPVITSHTIKANHVVTTNAKSAHSNNIIANAKRYSGIPYVWGGTTTRGFDCSGYVQFVYKANGINLPRTAEAQRRATTHVKTPKVGDLVFFGAPAYHVAIYAGNGKIYEAAHTGTVTGIHTLWTNHVTYGHVK